jgi:hypothetical protein
MNVTGIVEETGTETETGVRETVIGEGIHERGKGAIEGTTTNAHLAGIQMRTVLATGVGATMIITRVVATETMRDLHPAGEGGIEMDLPIDALQHPKVLFLCLSANGRRPAGTFTRRVMRRIRQCRQNRPVSAEFL